MAKERSSSKVGFLKSCLKMTCPQCRSTNLFITPGYFVYRSTFKMHETCSNCGLKFELEPGFWYGALWASYPLLILVEFPFLILALLGSWGNHWSPLVVMVLLFILLWTSFIRLGRSIWLHVWVKYRK